MAATIKPEPGVPHEIGLCDRPFCFHLEQRVMDIATTNTPEEKQRQRDDILRSVNSAFTRRPGGGTVNCLWLDDVIDPEDENSPLLTEECLKQQQQRASRLRIFSPNLKASVVNRLAGLPSVHTGRGCACVFNNEFQHLIRALGGLDVVMLDAFGGWDHNVEPMLGQMIRLKLFRQSGASVMIVFTDRDVRFQKGMTVIKAALDVSQRLPKLFSEPDSVYSMVPKDQYAYGTTMHTIKIEVITREWIDQSRIIDGFKCVPVLCEDQPRSSKRRRTEQVEQKQKDTSSHQDLQNAVYECTTQNETILRCYRMMIPYDHRLIRCYPAWSQIIDPEKHLKLRVGSNKKTEWTCASCNDRFIASAHNILQSTGRCKKCNKKPHKNKCYYNGNIPIEIRSVLRAAVLQGVNGKELHEGIDKVSIYRIHQVDQWLGEIKTFSSCDILNNRYWGRSHISWLTAKTKTKNKKADHEADRDCNEENKIEDTRRSNKGDVTTPEVLLVNEKDIWSSLLLKIKNDISQLKSLWITDVYWRLLLPDVDVDKALSSSDFKWEATAERLRSLAAALSEICYDLDRPTITPEQYCIPGLFMQYHASRIYKKSEADVHQFLRILYDVFKSEPQIVD